MRSALKLLVPAVAASLMLAACGSSSKSSSETATNAAASGAASVKSAANAALGATVLVDSQGMTLYHLSGEQNGKFICASSACTQIWHPVTGTPSGSVGSLSTVKRPDGTMQITYKGMPLYTFAGDSTAGEAKGQGLKDVGTWSAVTVSAGAKTPSETSTGSGGGSRYSY
jgi:predicted lipoprotein with Yx(FWY)xxD motif